MSVRPTVSTALEVAMAAVDGVEDISTRNFVVSSSGVEDEVVLEKTYLTASLDFKVSTVSLLTEASTVARSVVIASFVDNALPDVTSVVTASLVDSASLLILSVETVSFVVSAPSSSVVVSEATASIVGNAFS